MRLRSSFGLRGGAVLVLITILLSPVILLADAAVPAGDHYFELEHGGLTRHFLVHVPPAYRPDRPVPLLVMLHGGGGKARSAMKETDWDQKADQEGFIAVFPEASPPDPERPGKFFGNPQIWNDGSGRFHAGERAIDDTGFIAAMLDDLESRYAVDRGRVYVTGFSNGASMAFRLAVELPDRFAAAAPVSGIFWSTRARPERALPLLFIFGDSDPLSPLEGGRVSVGGQTEDRPPVRETVDRWLRMAGCEGEGRTDGPRNGVRLTEWSCRNGAETRYYLIKGMGHVWPGGKRLLPTWLVGEGTDKLDATDEIWKYFKLKVKSKN